MALMKHSIVMSLLLVFSRLSANLSLLLKDRSLRSSTQLDGRIKELETDVKKVAEELKVEHEVSTSILMICKFRKYSCHEV